MNNLRFALLLLLAAIFTSVYASEAPVQLTWEDLEAKLPAGENPYASLSAEQLEALSEIAAFRMRKANGDVKADKPYELKRPFDPVWVTGRIAAGALKKSLYLADGTTDLDVGYSIQAGQVEPYR